MVLGGALEDTRQQQRILGQAAARLIQEIGKAKAAALGILVAFLPVNKRSKIEPLNVFSGKQGAHQRTAQAPGAWIISAKEQRVRGAGFRNNARNH